MTAKPGPAPEQKNLSDFGLFMIYFAVLMVMWLLLSGHYDLKYVMYGVLTCAFGAGVGVRTFRLPIRGDGRQMQIAARPLVFFKLLGYCGWLIYQIILANIQVAFVILNPALPIVPQIIRFRLRFENPIAVFVLANSITLTPGTITLDVEGDVFTVHALIGSAAAEWQEVAAGKPNVMIRRIAGLFGEPALPGRAEGMV